LFGGGVWRRLQEQFLEVLNGAEALQIWVVNGSQA